LTEYGQNISLYGTGRSHFMQQSGPTEIAVSRLKGGTSVTQLLHEANGPALGDYLFQFLRKTPRSVETIAGLAGLNKSSLYRILNAEVSPQRNVLLRLSRVLGMNLSETQKLLKIGDLASLSGSSPRDIVIIDGILRELDIIDINNHLEKNGFSDLFSKK
jgi:hypothetical protein